MPRTIDLNDIRLLMQVIEHGSYTAASRSIGVPKSTISQRIAALERTVGTGLLRRTSRSFSLTDAGVLLLPHARAIEDLARTVEMALLDQGGELGGTLRISCSSAIAQFALSPLIPRFLEKHADVSIRVAASNRVVDLIGEGYDMALRAHIGPLKNSTLIQRVVARAPWSLAASPAWTEAHGVPACPSDLALGQVLYFSTSSDGPGLTLERNGEEVVLPIEPRMVCDDMASLRATALANGGVACLPAYLLTNALESGQLNAVLPDWILPSSTISLLTPPRTQSSRLTRAFSDFLAKEMPRIMRV